MRFVTNNIEFKLGTGVSVGGRVRNAFDAHQPRDPNYLNVYSVLAASDGVTMVFRSEIFNGAAAIGTAPSLRKPQTYH
jgi:hypothetical protein